MVSQLSNWTPSLLALARGSRTHIVRLCHYLPVPWTFSPRRLNPPSASAARHHSAVAPSTGPPSVLPRSVSGSPLATKQSWYLAHGVSQEPFLRPTLQFPRAFAQGSSPGMLEQGEPAGDVTVDGSSAPAESTPSGPEEEATQNHSEARNLKPHHVEGWKGPASSETLVPSASSSTPGKIRGEGRRLRLRRGQEVELVCHGLSFKGMGKCYVAGSSYVVFCERALPGETLLARVTRSKGTFAEAFKLRTLTPHADPAEPPCEHFGHCGGCKFQNLAYHAQLREKQQQVADLMERLGGFSPSEGYLKPIIGCKNIYNYRNKMEFSFGARVWSPVAPDKEARGEAGIEGEGETRGVRDTRRRSKEEEDEVVGSRVAEPEVEAAAVAEGGEGGGEGEAAGNEEQGSELPESGEERVEPPRGFALGLHVPRRFDKILPINECHLQDKTANRVLAFVREYCAARREELPAYDPVLHQGFLRHLTLRTGPGGPGGVQLMLNIATKESGLEVLRPLVHELVALFPEVASVVNTVNASLSDVAPKDAAVHVLHGTDRIEVPLRDLVFEVSPSSFFQTNTEQAEVLYREVEEACALRGDGSETMLDLFCGTGSIGLSLAPKVRQVVGYELVPEAVADARRNARRNGIDNAVFLEGDLSKVLPELEPEPAPEQGESSREAEAGEVVTSGLRPDVVITDPNRPGMHPKLLAHLARVRAPRIVYVSCNPATCARDMSILCHGEKGQEPGPYKLLSVQPVDMFPHTPHVECVATLVLRDAA